MGPLFGDYWWQKIRRSLIFLFLKDNFDVLLILHKLRNFLSINGLYRDDRRLFYFSNFLFLRILLNLCYFLIGTFWIDLLLSLWVRHRFYHFQMRLFTLVFLLTARQQIKLLFYLAFAGDQTIFLGRLCQVPLRKLVKKVTWLLIYATLFLFFIFLQLHLKLIHLIVEAFKIEGWFTML